VADALNAGPNPYPRTFLSRHTDGSNNAMSRNIPQLRFPTTGGQI